MADSSPAAAAPSDSPEDAVVASVVDDATSKQQQARMNKFEEGTTATAATSNNINNAEDDPDGSRTEAASSLNDEDSMALLFYQRLLPDSSNGGADSSACTTNSTCTIHTTVDCICTCATMGRVILNAQSVVDEAASSPDTTTNHPSGTNMSHTTSTTGSAATANNNNTTTSSSSATTTTSAGDPISFLQWQSKPVPLAIQGYANGTIRITDAATGTCLHQDNNNKNKSMFTCDPHKKLPIVSVAVDATGTVWTAIDQGGNCRVWTVTYRLAYRHANKNNNNTTTTAGTNTTASAATAAAASLTNFFWRSSSSTTTTTNNTTSAATGTQPSTTTTTSGSGDETAVADTEVPASDAAAAAADPNESDNNNNKTPDNDLVPMLSIADVKSTLLQYPKREYGLPTGIVLDPAYRKTSKLLVAFDSGKLVVSAPNWMFRMEHVVVSYPGAPLTDPAWRGIAPMAWRGGLLAFCDCSGVKLYDMSTYKPVAHVDRPAGVKKGATASLCFESTDSLLVAWGDCLLHLVVVATTTAQHPSAATNNTTTESPELEAALHGGLLRRRTVSCRMAWSLDCTAAGVAPMDQHHVAVLGYDEEQYDDDDDENDPVQSTLSSTTPIVEFQIIDRRNGQLVWADVLPLRQPAARPQSSLLSTMYSGSASPAAKSVAPPNFLLLSSFATPRMDETLEMIEYQKTVVDPYMEWDLQNVDYTSVSRGGPSEDPADDTLSIDSDDYDFLFPTESAVGNDTSTMAAMTNGSIAAPPVLLFLSSVDVVGGNMRTVDDAIDYALDKDRSATALKLAMQHPSLPQQHDMTDLVNGYLQALLSTNRLSLRRMKMASDALPLLLGADPQLWDEWVRALGEIPGALFVVRSVIPVRDPILPNHLFARVLGQMLSEVEIMKAKSAGKLATEAEGHFLNTLLDWGTTRSLHEHAKLYQQACQNDASFEALVKIMKESLRHRSEQTAVGYLNPAASTRGRTITKSTILADSANDSLYDIPEILDIVSQRVSFVEAMSPGRPSLNSRIALDSMARLNMMMQNYEEALRYFLFLGTLHTDLSLESIEENGLDIVNMDETENVPQEKRPYSFVLPMIANHDLHDCLLNIEMLPDMVSSSPICAVARLVGLDAMGEFLMEHCVGPEQKETSTQQSSQRSTYLPPAASTATTDRRGTLPLDLVAQQLAGSPKLLHWYLHLVFTKKPEVYVKFPNTTTPPAAITSLHKKHLDLHIKFAGPNRDSTKALAGVEAYRVVEKSTPLLSFLKVVLKLGAISALGVGKMLEIERRGGAGISRTFALELAYIMENFGSKTESDAQLILELYLRGAQSLMLAVAYAQRNKRFSTVLWDTLVSYCLSETTEDGSVDGTLFGSLLEAAALSGADLAQLVAKIPPGMQVEGLRPRLVAAVADYRLKVQLHETSSSIASDERLLLVRETSHRMRRGLRVGSVDEASTAAEEEEVATAVEEKLASSLKTKTRPRRYYHNVSVPIR